MLRPALVGLLLTLPAFAQQAPTAPDELAKYVAKPEPAYAWKLKDKAESDAGKLYLLSMTSQTWQGIVWEHELQVFAPKGVDAPTGFLLINTGGKPNAPMVLVGTELARKMQLPVAVLYGVPKQPLFGGKREDALIAETFVQYLDSGDATWPLLFPMTKSVIKAMDAVQAFAKQEWKADVKKFVITGASKRGWTAWLTAATGDARVVGIAPMVIDTLNFAKQMPHQVESFGAYSAMIKDYEDRKLLPLPDTDAARKLWLMVDPWAYREKLGVPKLIINGTNDPYWTQDALSLYWDDLPGTKHVRFVPNSGHDLRPSDKPNQPGQKKDALPMAAIDALSAFTKLRLADKQLPAFEWKLDAEKHSLNAKSPGAKFRVWRAASETADFRKSQWTPGTWTGAVGEHGTEFLETPKDFQARLIESEFDSDGLKYSLTTGVLVVGPKK